MVAPVIVLAGAMAGSAILNYVLNEGVANSQIKMAEYTADYSRRYNIENRRYWSDYYKNTGKLPRYPMRAGAEYNLAGFYGSTVSKNSAIASKYRAAANVAVSGAYSLGALYRQPNTYQYVSPYPSYNYAYR